MHKRWGLSALIAFVILPTPVSQALPAPIEQEKKKSPKQESTRGKPEGPEGEEQPSEQEAESQRERIRIRVLSDPRDISSFYRRSGSPSYPYYGYPSAPPYDAYTAPRAPDTISQYYRSRDSWANPFFYPGYGGAVGNCYYGRRGLFDRAPRPSFFLETLPRGFCPCPCDPDGK